MTGFLKYSWLFLLVFLVWTGFIFVGPALIKLAPDTSSQDIGTFGDMFGSLNALFSGLAFAGLIVAIVIQNKELKLQNDTLELQKDELRQTREVFEEQSETLKKQQFESTFFQMVSLHNDIINSIQIRDKNGREAFNLLFKDTLGVVNSFFSHGRLPEPLNSVSPLIEQEIKNIVERYLDLYKGGQGNKIGHYFRNLYNIIKLVENSEIKNKKLYTNIIRAQLSVPELVLLMINCSTYLGSEKFKPLIEKYSLLSNLVDTPELVELKKLAKNYHDSAFA